MDYKLYIETKSTSERELILQDRAVIPSTNGTVVVSSEGFDGIRTVTIQGDENLIPENIKSGVSIFNVLGTYGSPYDYFQHIRRIENEAFKGDNNIHNIKLPNNLEYLGNSVFENCNYLNEVIIDCPNLTLGGKNTFSNSSLSSIIFMNTDYELIDNNLLVNCDNLKNITVPPDFNTSLNFSKSDIEFEVLNKLIKSLKDNDSGNEKSIVFGAKNISKLNTEEFDLLDEKKWVYDKD